MWSESLLRIVNNLITMGSSYSMNPLFRDSIFRLWKPLDFAGAKFIHAKVGGNSSWHPRLDHTDHTEDLTILLHHQNWRECIPKF